MAGTMHELELGAEQPLTAKEPTEFLEIPLARDRILEEIGQFGLYQILVGITTGIALCITGFATFNFIFATTIPEHRFVCRSSLRRDRVIVD